jgi:putative transposase
VNRKRRPSPPHNPGVQDLVRSKREWSRSLPQEVVVNGSLGWYERGYLPHRDEPGLVQFVSFRLADAFPEEKCSEWKALLKTEDDHKRRIELETYLDKGRGACHLRRPEIAKIVEDSLKFRHGEDYELRAWVIMPNHVHVLFKLFAVPMPRLLDAWKGFTAKQANKFLGRRGKLWQDDYWDTYMRDQKHEHRTRAYIEDNPVNAALTPESKIGLGAVRDSGMITNVFACPTDGTRPSRAQKRPNDERFSVCREPSG